MVKLKSVGRYVMEDRTLGKGNFAVVELASHSVTKSKVAVKIIDRRKIKEEYMLQNMYREAKVMSRLRHPNIVRLYETIKSNNLYFLVTEYVAGGDLLTYVRNQRDGFLSESRSRGFVRQLVSALHHLHERGVVHRDLKMENIILDEKRKNLKLIDFGLSNVYHANQLLKTHCGSPEYAAPELFVTGREYGPEVDIWSFGVIVYAMVTGKLPFTTPHTENRRQRLLQQINAGLGSIHEKDMQHLSEDCRGLLRKCIEPSSIARIHLLDIMTHTWISVGGKETFYTFQQPPKDPNMKACILDQMASLLNVDKSMLENQVNENHCDEAAAVFNLLLDEMLRERGMWEGDHTRRSSGVRRKISAGSPQNRPTGVRNSPSPKSSSQTPTAAIEPPLRLRTPTIVGMVRPSSRNEGVSPLQSADFELSVVESRSNIPDRPRSSTTQPLYTRPMGNATTINSILARQQHFPRPATSPSNIDNIRNRKNRGNPALDRQLVAPSPSSADLPAARGSTSEGNTLGQRRRDGRNGAVGEPHTATSARSSTSQSSKDQKPHHASGTPQKTHADTSQAKNPPPYRNHVGNQENTSSGKMPRNASPRTHRVPQRPLGRTEPVKKRNFHARQKLPSGDHINDLSTENPQPEPRLQVIDMGRYLSAKHGYQTSETAIAVHPGPSNHPHYHRGAGQSPSPATNWRGALNICDAHLEQLRRTDSPNSAESRNDRSRPPAAVGNTTERTKPRAATPVQIQLYNRGSSPSHNHPVSSIRGRTDNRRYAPRPTRGKSRPASHDSRMNSPEIPKDQPRCDSPDTWSNVSTRSPTPVISYIKRTGRPPSRSLYKTPVASMISSEGCIPNAVRRESHLAGDGSLVESSIGPGMPPRPEWRRSQSAERKVKSSVDTTRRPIGRGNRDVRQPVPDRNLRVQSAKIKKDDRSVPGQQNKNNRRIPKPKKDQVNSSDEEHNKMIKYAGHVAERTNAASDGEFGVLGEFSTRGLLGALLSRQNAEDRRTPPQLKQNELTPQWKAEAPGKPAKNEMEVSRGAPRQRYVHVPASFNFIDKDQLSSTKTKSIDVQRPPLVKPTGMKAVQVFDVHKSQDVSSVDLPSRSVIPRSHGNGNVDWGRTYSLERKVSDTLKGGNDIARMRRTPEPVRYS